jgi:hypothetical protein
MTKLDLEQPEEGLNQKGVSLSEGLAALGFKPNMTRIPAPNGIDVFISNTRPELNDIELPNKSDVYQQLYEVATQIEKIALQLISMQEAAKATKYNPIKETR